MKKLPKISSIATTMMIVGATSFSNYPAVGWVVLVAGFCLLIYSNLIYKTR